MKPSFALALSFDGIALLHRAFPGWNRVGEVSLDSSDLSGALAVLRDTAQQINGAELTSKLVIPNDQIKYLALDLGMTDEPARQDAIRAALSGATPYPAEDLVFDWSVEGDKTQVAAVARETLTEAEQFATEHGFGPISFVAIPPEGQFSGEPFFGPTAHAHTVLSEGETVQRDMAPIRVTGVARLPEADPEAEPASESEADIDAGHAVDPEITAEDAPPEVLSLNEDESEAQELPPVQHGDDIPDEATSGALPGPPEPFAAFDESAASAPTGGEAEAEAEEHAASDGAPEAIPAFTTIRARRDDMGDTVGPLPDLSAVRRPLATDMTAPTIPIEPDVNVPGAGAAPPVGTAETPELQDAATATDDPEPEARPDDTDDTTVIPAAPEDLPDREPITAQRAAPARSRRLSFFSRRDRSKAPRLEPEIGASGPDRAPDIPPAPIGDIASEEERMTIFGARQSAAEKQAAIGGKPRYLGLVMTAVLLLFLAGVAAWASIFVDDGLARFFAPRDAIIATLPEDSVDELSIEGDEAMVPTLPLEQEPDEVFPDEVETAALEIWPEEEVEAEAPPARSEPQPPRAMTPDEAQTRYAVTGVWLRAPEPPSEPAQESLDDLYVASIDPRVEEHDAVALPGLDALDTDYAMATPAVPFPRGTRFDLDERGLAVASVDGTLSPGGFLVFRGRPEITPGAVPDRAPDAADPETDETREARAELAALRPRPRPEGLIESNERQNLGGITWAEIARVRPRPRPEQDLAKIEEEADTTGTVQAVAESPKPAPRPRNFASVVERAQEAEPQEATQVAAAVPRQQSVAPSIPSQSNVAKVATVRNQLNLRKVNLIGVYGKPSARRALVRLSNGRYKKVKVGDRLDGGQVQAIGDTELRYQKRGRNVILQMPRG